MPPDIAAPSPAARRTWFGLAVLMLPVLLVSMDFSVLYLAMPTIVDSLDSTATQQLWILDIYGFMIAGLLITMGNIGDRIGRRRILLVGAAVFGGASVLAAFAPGPEALIAARALMGVGGATLMPASLALIANMFTDPRQRARAIGIWTSAFAGGAAIGPVLGGLLLHHYWWGIVFLINVPVLAILFAAGPFILPEFRATSTDPFDVPGVVLSLLGILPGVYAVKAFATAGVSPQAVLAGLFGLAMLVVFLWHESRATAPLVNLRLFRNPTFSACVAVALVGMMAEGGIAYLSNTYLQSVLGHDVLAAALAGLPMAVTVATFSIVADRVARLLGPRLALAGSVTLAGVSNIGFLALGTSSPLWIFMTLSAVAGVGYGVVFSLVTDIVVGSAPPEQSGAASAISETSFELGTALGLALLGSLATAVFLSDDAGHGFADSLGETLKQTEHLGAAGEATADAAKAAFVDGMHVAAVAGGGTLLVLALVVFVAMRRRPRAPSVDVAV
ncbi:MFS transporter [Gordonia hydrophobica]|uniref:MFS transporter n=1 Tax=Gordonia hydrophobica TaxID=40516 RepID=A0ABZ2U4N5_9ACTN|nr:MFS transporter [Gordonia hydrophobica]MBM7368360.1 DHA2 family multidrug resistance protein-like MFS transporter [Gordonia hydrophobica]